MARARKRSRPSQAARPDTPSPETVRSGTLALAVALAGLAALWALFQWTQLVNARGGGEAFCGLGGDSCVTLWDSPFAAAVQRGTGLPVAAWGLVWAVVAFAMPLATLARRAGSREALLLRTATVWTALSGVLAVLVLAAVSLGTGRLCTTCAVTYALVLGYATACFVGAGRLQGTLAWRGGALAAGSTTLVFLLLLPLGLRTPGAAAPALVDLGTAPGTLDQRLAELPGPERQLLSDTLEAWRRSDAAAPREARALLGPALAPVRIVEFSDALCSHCAKLHEVLERFRERLPGGSFAIDSRQFPLDAGCNPLVEHRSETNVSCLAARIRICLEDRPEAAFALSGALFRNQRSLDPERVLDLASSYLPRARLEACVEAPETDARLREDIAWATELGVQGTPFVLVNGRHAFNFPPLLEALVLAQADPAHPAFASLPRPQPLPGS